MTCPICTAPNAESNISVLSFYPPPPATRQWVALPLCAECRDILETLPDREIIVPRLTRAGALVPDWALERARANDPFRRPMEKEFQQGILTSRNKMIC